MAQILQRDLFVRRLSIYRVRISRWISRWISMLIWSSDFRVTPCKGIQDGLGFWIPRYGFPDSSTGFLIVFKLELGFRIPIVCGIPDSLSQIPDSKAQDSVLHKRICSGFRIPQAKVSILTWGDSTNTHHASEVKALCNYSSLLHAAVQIQMPLMWLWSLKSRRDFTN